MGNRRWVGFLGVILLAVSGGAHSNDQFEIYATQNNARAPMSVLTGEALKLYEKEDNPDDPGQIIFGTAKWANGLGVAPFVLNLKKRKQPYTGYMAFLLDERDKVKSIMWTHGQPEESWTTWDLELGQAADVGSTLLALSQGFVEGNPVAQGPLFPVIMAGKLVGGYYYKRHSLRTCQATMMASGLGTGAAVLNGFTVATGAFAPWALVPAGVAVYALSPGKNEAFWDCAKVFASGRADKLPVAEVAQAAPQPASLFLDPE